jgi:hypothetical protein
MTHSAMPVRLNGRKKRSDMQHPERNRRIDREMNGQRLAIRTGKLSQRVHDGLDAMLTHIKKTGNIGLWMGLKEGTLDALALYESYLRDKFHDVILVESVKGAKAAMLEWVETRANPTTRKSYGEIVQALFRDAPDATIDELPEVLQAVRDRYEKLGQKNQFGQCRKVASSWAGKTYGKDSALWRRLRAIPPLESSSHVHKQEARAVWDVIATVKAMREPFGAMFWTMCILGTGTKEYLSDGFTVVDGKWVTIHGQKNKARVRRTPLVFANLVPSSVSYANRKAFDRELHAVQPEWDLYDARRTFSHWCEEALIPVPRIQAYMGQDPQTVNEKYRKHNVDPYLTADAERLRNYINANRKRPKPSKKMVPIPTFSFDE